MPEQPFRIEPAIVGWSNWRSGCEFYEDTTSIVVMEKCYSCEGSGQPKEGTQVLQGDEWVAAEVCHTCKGSGEIKAPNMPRWMPRAVNQGSEKHPNGRLLTDYLDDPEGATAVVVLFPRGENPQEAAERVRQALSDERDGGS